MEKSFVAALVGLACACSTQPGPPLSADDTGATSASAPPTTGKAPGDTGKTASDDGVAAAGHDDAGAPQAGSQADGAAPTDPSEPAAITFADKSRTTDAWWSYTRPATFTVATSDVQVQTRDGTSLVCKLYRPATDGSAAAGKFPGLVVEFTPYALQADQYATESAFFVTRGYNALVCLLRGVGGSGGTWQHAFARQDGLDASDLVEWLANQPFSDGRIGMFGESYGGQTTYGAAVDHPAHLRAVAPMQSPANLYDDVLYSGGIESVAGGSGNVWPYLATLMSFGAISADDEFAVDHAHPTYDSFWQERSLLTRYADIKVPVLGFGGWTDNFFRSGMLTNVEGALDRTWVIYGQWIHTIPVDLGTCQSQCAPDPVPGGVLLAWFDHWVMERKDVPIPEKPSFLSFEGGVSGKTRGWRELSRWVPRGTEPVTYELGSDGVIAETAGASAPMKFHEPGEASESGSGLTFSSAPLATDRVLVGHPVLHLRATLSAPDANFYVTVLDVDAMDNETFVNDGYLKASHRDSHITPTPAPAGQPIDYQIEVRAQHYRFAAGHRLRLRIWGGAAAVLVQTDPVDVTIETGSRATLTMPGFATPQP